MLEAAMTALESGRDEEALDELLAAWRDSRDRALADVIDLLGARLDARRPRPGGKTVKDKEVAWHALAGQRRAADVGSLLATISDVARAASLERRIAALAQRPADPRVARMLATMTRQWPILGETGYRSLRLALELIVAIGDVRARDVLEAAASETGATTRRWLVHHAGGYIAALSARSEATTVPAAMLARFRALVATPATTTDAATLLAAVYANPDDDGARLVLADLLQQQGDPRGEFIALQLAGTKSRREAALLRTYARDWLGPIAPAIAKAGLVYERGFVARCAVKRPNVTADQILEEPAWATIVELDTSGWARPGQRAATLMPGLRRLVGVNEAMPSHPRLEHVTFEALQHTEIARFGVVDAPRLTSLAIAKAFFDVAIFAPFWSTPVGRGLETFAVDGYDAARWLVDLQPRLGDRLRSVTVSMRGPWQFTLTADGVLRCRYIGKVSPSDDDLADRLDALPASVCTRAVLDSDAIPGDRLARALQRFT